MASERASDADPRAGSPAGAPTPFTSRPQLARLLNGLQAFVGVLDVDGRLVQANDAPLEAAGLALADVVGRPFWDTPWWRHSDVARARIRTACELAAAGRGSRFDVEYSARDGRRRWLDFSIVPLTDDAGRVTQLVPSGIDIHDRKLAEQALESSHARFELAAEAVEGHIYDYDVATERVIFTAGVHELTGHTADELASTAGGWQRLIHPDDADATARHHRERLAAGATRYESTYRIVRRDGTVRHVLDRTRVLRDAGGRPVRAVGSVVDITALRAAESARERNAALLDAVMSALPVGLAVAAPTGELLRWNAACQALWGLDGIPPSATADVAGYVTWKGWRHPTGEPLGAHDWPMARAVERGEHCAGELIEIERFDGTGRRIALISSAPVLSPTGERLGAVAVQGDVTERVRAEQAVRATEERLRIALDAANAGVFDWDAATDVSVWSDRHYRLFGYAPGEVTPTTALWLGHIHPDDRARVEAVTAEALATGRPFAADYRVCAADGVERWLNGQGIGRLDREGRLVGLVGAVVDITARKRVEQELEAANARLREATLASGLGIHEYYPQTGAIVWDRRLRTWWGVDEHAPVTFETFLDRIHPDDRAATLAAVEASFDPAGRGRYDTEYRVVHPDGTLRWIHATGNVTFVDGRAVRLLGTAQDVTADKQLTEELLAADRKKDEFLATLSHELRNPLAPIRTAARLLADPKLPQAQQEQARRIIQRQVAHMAWLLDDLLDLARITQGKLVLKRERVSLTAVVDSAVEAVRPLLDARHHHLHVTLPDAAPTLDADPVRLAQILSNLLTNAAKYTDPHGRIELEAATDGAELAVRVRDNGVGLAPEALGRIFEMFAQVDGTAERGEGGLGIGLAIVRGLARLHGGTVAATSDGPGRGSEFCVRLPIVVTDVPATDSAAPSPAHGRRRVLVADDNQDAACTLGMLVELAGHEVRVAHGGRQALSLARAFRPDLALLDIGMPELDGYAVARALRAEPWARDLELIALTGWGQDEDRARAREAGFDRHLTKPIDPDLLERLLAAPRGGAATPGSAR